MKKLIISLVFVLLISNASAQQDVYLIEFKGTIDYGTANFIISGIEKAEKDDAILVIQLDTPGGLVDPMKDIVTKMENSKAPVVIYVAPEGAWAESAGSFILMASHVAAMAPGTLTGSAHPVGYDPEDEVMEEKVTNALQTYMKGIAERHDRPSGIAERFVNESLSVTAEEALEEGVIEIIASDTNELLSKMDGMEVEVSGSDVVLNTKNSRVTKIEPSFRDKFMQLIGNPSIMYILFMIGIYGIIMELYNPGSVLPGVLGGICIILAIWGMGVIDANLAGVALILLAIIFFIAETQLPTSGLLAVAGVICLVIGSLMISWRKWMPEEEQEPYIEFIIPWELITAVTIVTAGFFLFAVAAVIKAMKRKVVTGEEGMIGMEGVADTGLKPHGRVYIRGERWKAESTIGDIEKGEKVRVVRTEGLKLFVEKI
ncbi:MAG: hypothetical protein A7316_05590 [Candidatus Altiarchaeales archaeon WOR_SM1_86-2]|nr:MAG: hypothetical protein A7316_05590 [Candidatus Altiarchaeales archaeon WOR_SM1_86-2]